MSPSNQTRKSHGYLTDVYLHSVQLFSWLLLWQVAHKWTGANVQNIAAEIMVNLIKGNENERDVAGEERRRFQAQKTDCMTYNWALSELNECMTNDKQ